MHAVCPGKKSGEFVRTAIHDFEGDQTYSEKRGHNFALNATFDEVKPQTYDALIIPGGRAPEYLRLNARVLEIVRHCFHDQQADRGDMPRRRKFLRLQAYCTEERCSCYPAVGPEVAQSGGTFADLAMTDAVVDGNLVTWTRLASASGMVGSKFLVL